MGSSSQSTETSYDPVGSFVQAYTSLESINLAKGQDARAGELWDFYKSNYFPYDKATMEANLQALPAQSEYLQAATKEATRDIQMGQANKDALRGEQLKEIERSSPVADAFYQSALDGIKGDYEGVMGRASADVAQGHATALGMNARNQARMGVSPDSGAASAQNLSSSLAYAKDAALARTIARLNEKSRVEDVNFNRLSAGMNARGMASGLQGTVSMQGNQTGALGGYGISNPLNASLNASGQAIQGMGHIASIQPRQTGSTTTKNDGGAGIMSSVAGMGGAIGGALIMM